MEYKQTIQFFSNSNTTLFGALKEAVDHYPLQPALCFLGKEFTFNDLMKDIEASARALLAAGVHENDCVTFMMPNCPQAVAIFYAINRIGAVSNMIHTLSSDEEITYYLDKTNSQFLVITDISLEKAVVGAKNAKKSVKVIVTSLSERMPLFIKLGYLFKSRKKKTHSTKSDLVIPLQLLKKQGRIQSLPSVVYRPERVASILYSGGSTGLPKGICLSDKNINSLSIQIANSAGHNVAPGLKFLSAMPFFHGFGLGIGLHAIVCNGAESVLVPQFSLDSYVKTLLKEKTNMLAIVPSMLEAFLRSNAFEGKDLSFLKGIFCGADTIPLDLEKRVNLFLESHGCKEQVRAGYGLTECVTVCTLNPIDCIKAGSIGLPIGEMKCRIVKPDSFEDCPIGEAGELIVAGPTVMMRYLDEPEETAKILRTDKDGSLWLFTGDLCRMDEDGFVFFIQRLKRLIITSGYNVYPAQVERVIAACPCVKACCVVGVQNKIIGQTVAAIIVPNDDNPPNLIKEEVLSNCKKRLAQYAVPTRIELRQELPLTKMGKINYIQLEKELNEKAGNKSC